MVIFLHAADQHFDWMATDVGIFLSTGCMVVRQSFGKLLCILTFSSRHHFSAFYCMQSVKIMTGQQMQTGNSCS